MQYPLFPNINGPLRARVATVAQPDHDTPVLDLDRPNIGIEEHGHHASPQPRRKIVIPDDDTTRIHIHSDGDRALIHQIPLCAPNQHRPP